MSSSWSDSAGEALADRGWSGDCERGRMVPPPRLRPNCALSSDWSIVVSWLWLRRPWFMSFMTSIVTGEELPNWEPIEWPRSWSEQQHEEEEHDA